MRCPGCRSHCRPAIHGCAGGWIRRRRTQSSATCRTERRNKPPRSTNTKELSRCRLKRLQVRGPGCRYHCRSAIHGYAGGWIRGRRTQSRAACQFPNRRGETSRLVQRICRSSVLVGLLRLHVRCPGCRSHRRSAIHIFTCRWVRRRRAQSNIPW